MAEQLTFKQREFVREYISNGGNGTEAALAVYDTESQDVAANIASDNIRIPKIATAMQAALAKLELTEDNIAVAVRDALQATKIIAMGGIGEDVMGEPFEIADHSTRLKAAEFAAKLMDAMPMKRRLEGASRIRELHQHVHLAAEPVEVLEWQAQHGRRPTAKERDKILGVKLPVDNIVTDRENVPANTASHSKHKAKRNGSS